MREHKYEIKRCLLTAITVLIVSTLLCACMHGAAFDGSITEDEDHFDMTFEILNTSYSHELKMKEGEALEVTVDAESGNLSLIIQKDDNKPIYQGNKIKSAKFQVGIDTEGTYTLTVTGRKARGYVMIRRVEGGINGE
ncbi:hypothetical protein [Butyrivibrio sp. NC2007]|uniref:hypothetical protein n=1 Tax=Butyrivibrio sp. NC2007 TaxID=1280683 RepID=UPI0003B71CDF|nr:hypothetical protein [Butyrivibrio sp. NC2007]